MKLKKSSFLMIGVVVSLIGVSPAYAYVNFDTVVNTKDLNGNLINGVTSVVQDGLTLPDPSSAIIGASSTYVGVSGIGPQTINTDVASFTGGVVLGLATFFPAITFASSPNVYGTADFGNGLSNTLSIAMNGSATTNEVSFALFNGETFNQTYQINALDINGKTLGSTTIQNIVPNWQSGYSIVDLKFLSDPNNQNSSLIDFSKVTINAISSPNQPIDKPGLFDFLIDDVAFGQNLASIVDPSNPSVPVNVSSPGPTPSPVVPYVYNLPVPSIDPSVPSIVESQTPTTVCRGQGNSRKCVQATVDTVVDYGDNANNRKGNATQFTKVDDSNEILDVQELTEPVPEPESYAMMLAGFGVMGFVVRRRRTGS